MTSKTQPDNLLSIARRLLDAAEKNGMAKLYASTSKGGGFHPNEFGAALDAMKLVVAGPESREIDRLQARIDELMLEHCPEEMTKEQLARWAKAQRPLSEAEMEAFDNEFCLAEVKTVAYMHPTASTCVTSAEPDGKDVYENARELVPRDAVADAIDWLNRGVAEWRHMALGYRKRLLKANLPPSPVITNDMVLAFHHALGDGPVGREEMDEIRRGLAAAMAGFANPRPPAQDASATEERLKAAEQRNATLTAALQAGLEHAEGKGWRSDHVAALFRDAMAGNPLQDTFADVVSEVLRATGKYPTWPTDPLHALAVLGEKYGELNKAMLQLTYEPHKTSADEVRSEALQTAAMALRLAMSLPTYRYQPCEQHRQDDIKETASCKHKP